MLILSINHPRPPICSPSVPTTYQPNLFTPPTPLPPIPHSLTLALMGSDDMQLRVLAQSSSDPKEQKQAARVLRLLERGRHWVLVVLLLSNVVSRVTTTRSDPVGGAEGGGVLLLLWKKG